jgi:hypothetical protein
MNLNYKKKTTSQAPCALAAGGPEPLHLAKWAGSRLQADVPTAAGW